MDHGLGQFIPLILIIIVAIYFLKKRKSQKLDENMSPDKKKQTWIKILISILAFGITGAILNSQNIKEEGLLQFLPLIIGFSTYWFLSKKGNFLKEIFNKATNEQNAYKAGKLLSNINYKSPKTVYYVAGIAIFFAAVSFFNRTRAYDTAGTMIVILTVLWVIFLAVISLPMFKDSLGGRDGQSRGVMVGWVVWAIIIGMLGQCSINL
tara:strand:- start:250 stop:873 length:624 start_codon:yes stop_codon:yes gene_type:complete